MSHPTTTTTTPPIAIIGAGPCGLTLARLLERTRVPYVAFERDASLSLSPSANGNHNNKGGTLDIHAGTGQAALDADRPEIDRRQLRGLLLDSVPAGRVRWGKALRAVGRADSAGVVLRFADGSSETGFRLIVGADGAWSKVRPLLTSAKPHHSGKTSIKGRLTPSNPQYAAARELAGAGTATAMGAGRLLVVQQMGDRTYRIYAGFEERKEKEKEKEGTAGSLLAKIDFAADAEASRAALLDLFADWAPHLRAFIEAAEGPWRVWPLYTFSPEVFSSKADGDADGDGNGDEKKTWTRAPGVALLGDAAHLGLPNGEGVNIAMVDALRLFECLSAELGFRREHEDEDENGEPRSGPKRAILDARADAAAVERAIVAYETPMRERAREHVEDGIATNDMIYHSPLELARG
ncbi:monooxygenase [Nemania sp. NC0429]|nr:monooxygenase [Nemania sp. NC0429]